ncbi:MAG: ParA family protein [Neisseriaceae bacterium]|nr:ParA family protein [Neisseriaceae bacterium]
MTTQTFDKLQEKFSTNRATQVATQTTQVVAVVSTKGGVGKTTLAANKSALIADFGFIVLMIDADVQPSLSKYYPLSYTAPNGIVELMLGGNNDENIRSCISKTIYPQLDIILSNNISGDIQTKIQSRPDRAVLLKSKLIHPIIRQYDFVLIDTQGSVGALQDAAAFAADLLISPLVPETLSAREFLSGTEEMLNRLSYGEALGLRVPPLFALLYKQDRTRDSKEISAEIRHYFNQFIDGKKRLLNTIIPQAKAYKEAASLRLPVHCHDYIQNNRATDCAFDIMHELAYEIWHAMAERKLTATRFNDGADLLPVEDLSDSPELPENISQSNQNNIVENDDKNGSGCLNENLAPSHHSSPKHSGSLLSRLVSLNQATEWKKGLSITVNEIIRNQEFAKTLSKDDYGKSIDLNKLHFPACFFANDTPIEQIQVAIAYISTCCLDNTSTEKVQALLDEMIDLSVDSPFEYFIELCQTANEANEKGEE